MTFKLYSTERIIEEIVFIQSEVFFCFWIANRFLDSGLKLKPTERVVPTRGLWVEHFCYPTRTHSQDRYPHPTRTQYYYPTIPVPTGILEPISICRINGMPSHSPNPYQDNRLKVQHVKIINNRLDNRNKNTRCSCSSCWRSIRGLSERPLVPIKQLVSLIHLYSC